MLIGIPRHADAADARSSAQPQLESLTARVATLERKMRLQATINLIHTSQIGALQNRSIRAELLPSGVTTVPPLSWGQTVGGVCVGGAAAGSTFQTDYPAELGTVSTDGSVHVFNPSPTHSVLLTSSVVCLSLSP
jgi:hypothetical protein